MRKALTLLLLMGACAPNTEVINSWKDPNAQPRKFNKVLAVFMTKDVGMRRAGEDELVRKLGKNAVASYTVLPESVTGDRAKAKAWIQKEGFDGLVIMRPLAVNQETTYVPGQAYVVPSHYSSAWGYWGTGWGYAYDPGYVQQDQVVTVEANVYSVADGKLIWASHTKTYNPESVKNLVNDIVDQTAVAMKREKAIATSQVAAPPLAAEMPLSFVTVSPPARPA
jgi:hypothetical protein